MAESELKYPYNVFPTDILRRVIGTLPTCQTEEVLDEIRKYHEELWRDEPVPAPAHKTKLSLVELRRLLDEDADSIVHANEGPRNYTEDEVREALDWGVDKGYVAYNDVDQTYEQTKAGREALSK